MGWSVCTSEISSLGTVGLDDRARGDPDSAAGCGAAVYLSEWF